MHLALRKNETKGRRPAYLCNQVYLEGSQEGRVGLQQHTCVESPNIGGSSYKTSQENKSCVPNRIRPLLHFNAAHLLCSALMSSWVALYQIMHCPFCTYRKRWQVFNRHFSFVFFHFFVLANCKQTAKTKETFSYAYTKTHSTILMPEQNASQLSC